MAAPKRLKRGKLHSRVGAQVRKKPGNKQKEEKTPKIRFLQHRGTNYFLEGKENEIV